MIGFIALLFGSAFAYGYDQQTGKISDWLEQWFPPQPKPIKNRPVQDYPKQPEFTLLDYLFVKYGRQYDIQPELLKAIAMQESSLNPDAQNPKSSARGLMQITKAAAADVGTNYELLFDAETNVRAGARYLRLLMDRHGFDIHDAIRSYYAGAGTILDGDRGRPFKHDWQIDAYQFANNKYLPGVLNHLENTRIG